MRKIDHQTSEQSRHKKRKEKKKKKKKKEKKEKGNIESTCGRGLFLGLASCHNGISQLVDPSSRRGIKSKIHR